MATVVTSENLICTVQSVSRPIKVNTFSVSETLNNRPVCSFQVVYSGVLPGDEGDEVIVTRSSDGDKVFAGRVVRMLRSVDESNNLQIASFSCGGYEVLADRRQVAEVYLNKSAGFIVNDLITQYLAADGITAGTIDTGDIIPRAVFGYEQLSSVLRKLADANGYIWYIDYDKALHFTERDLLSAPFEIDATVAGKRPVKDVRTELSLTQYRNRQIVQYNELTSLRTESFTGDGQVKTFTVEFPIVSKPVVEVNGVAQTVGIAGLDAEGAFDFYWSKNTPSVGQDVLAEPIGSDWALTFVPVDTNSTIGTVLTARGNYVVNLIAIDDTLVLYQVSNNFATVVQVFDPQYDNLNGVTFIDEEYLALTYTDSGTDYIRLIRRVGNSLEFAGTPLATSGVMLLSAESSNGEYIAASQTLTADSVNLFKFNKNTEAITLVDTITSSGIGSTSPIVYAWYNDYLAYAGFGSTLKIYKLDRSADTLSEIYSNSEAIGSQISSVAWVRNYLYSGFSTTTANPEQRQIIRHSLNTSTDTVTRLGTTTVTDIDDSQNVISINGYLIVSSRGATAGNNYYKVDTSNGDLIYFGNYIYPGSNGVITLAVSRNIGNSFVFGLSIGGETPLFILRQTGGIVSVTYTGSFPNVTVVNDFTEQSARIIAEGGTGIYEAFQSSSETDSEPSAIDIAQAILNRYGNIPKVFQFTTLEKGLATGQIIDVNWPNLGVNSEQMLIEKIDTRDEGKTLLWYTVRCISGIDIGNWQEFWRSLRPSVSFDFGGSDILPRAVSVSDAVGVGDTVTAISAASETNWNEGNWGEMEWQSRV